MRGPRALSIPALCALALAVRADAREVNPSPARPTTSAKGIPSPSR